jgi:hypothetical protein
MSSQINEQALGYSIEKQLTSTCLVELKERGLLQNLQERKEFTVPAVAFT